MLLRDPLVTGHLASRRGVYARVLVWVTARNRLTGTTESVGLWNGDHERVFVIDGAARRYFGVGGVMRPPAIVYSLGTSVRMQKLQLSGLSPEVLQAFRQYDARLAPIEIHRALFDPATEDMLGTPERKFKGHVDKAPIPRPAAGGVSLIEVTMASASRVLTRTLPARKSDATQRLRGGDEFRRYADVSGQVTVVWGEVRQ